MFTPPIIVKNEVSILRHPDGIAWLDHQVRGRVALHRCLIVNRDSLGLTLSLDRDLFGVGFDGHIPNQPHHLVERHCPLERHGTDLRHLPQDHSLTNHVGLRHDYRISGEQFSVDCQILAGEVLGQVQIDYLIASTNVDVGEVGGIIIARLRKRLQDPVADADFYQSPFCDLTYDEHLHACPRCILDGYLRVYEHLAQGFRTAEASDVLSPATLTASIIRTVMQPSLFIW